MTSLAAHPALFAMVTTGVGVLMMRLGLAKGRLREKSPPRRCPSCGRLQSPRGCERCGF